MPYTYIFDFRYRENHKNMMQNSILIFDEAHNIQKASEQGSSLSISSSELQNLQNKIGEFIKVNQ